MDSNSDNKLLPSKDIYVLNSNVGLTNVVDVYTDDSIFIITSTLDKIIQILESSYGYNAIHNLLIFDEHLTRFSTNVFTYDGIRSISNLNFVSLIQKYIANFIVYIGSRIEKKAYDGTTTGMLFTSLLLKRLFIFLNDSKKECNDYTFRIYLNAFCDTFKKIIKRLKIEIKEYAITDKKLISKKYLKPLLTITSKGSEDNLELVDLLCDIFKDIPPEIGIFQYGKSPVETDKKFIKIIPKEDYSILIKDFDKKHFNDPLCSKYEKDHANVIILPTTFQKLSKPYQFRFIDKLIKYSRTKYPKNDILLLTLFTNPVDIQKMWEQKRVIVYNYSTVDNILIDNPLELMIFLAISDKKSITDINSKTEAENIKDLSKYIITDIKVSYDGFFMKFYNLYKTVGYIHEFYYNKSKKKYHSLLNVLKKELDNINNSCNMQGIKQKYKIYQRLIYNMIGYKIPYIQLGGTKHEILSNIDMIEDMKGVSLISLDHGIVKNGMLKLLKIINEDNLYSSISKYDSSKIMSKSTFIDITNQILIPSIMDILEKQYIDEKSKNIPLSLSNIKKNVERALGYELTPESFKKIEVYQPIALFDEILKRILEISDLISTGYIIVPSGVVLQKKEENK